MENRMKEQGGFPLEAVQEGTGLNRIEDYTRKDKGDRTDTSMEVCTRKDRTKSY